MSYPQARTSTSVERFFQSSLLGLVASGYAALVGTHYLDAFVLATMSVALLLRAAVISGVLRLVIPGKVATAVALLWIAFFPADIYLISRSFPAAIMHAVCFLSAIKILTAQSDRDYVYVGGISFIGLIAAALLSPQSSFFAWLAIYVVFAIAVFTSAEIRRGFKGHETTIPPPRARIAWRLAAIAGFATAGILVLTAGLFLVVPRTARMAAMLFPDAHRIQLANVVDLGGFGKIQTDNRAIMHIVPYSSPLPPNLKWRGAALSRFDGKRWYEPVLPRLPGIEINAVNGSAVVADPWQRSRRDGRRFLYRVDMQNTAGGTLFIAGIPEFINVDAPRLLLNAEDSLRVLAPQREYLRYEVSAHSGPPLAWPLGYRERVRYLQLPPIDIRIYSLARQWAEAGTPLESALRIQRHLRRDFKYTLDGPEKPVSDPLADFLFVRKQGYCEYFASAMAVMLRSLGVPSRVATGFQTGYFNDVSGEYVVRASDAHAWVEAWIEGRGWTTFDPTPPASGNSRPGLFSRLDMYLDAADNAWREWVVSYDFGRQIALAATFEKALRGLHSASLPGAGGFRASLPRPKVLGTGLVLAFLLTALIFVSPRLWREWRKRARVRQILRSGGSQSDASILYERMLDVLSKRGFQKPGWFTPAEFARHLPPEENRVMGQFTELYNEIRFGGNTPAVPQLARLLQEFESR